LRNNAQLILHAKLLNKQSVPDPDDDSLLIEQDSESIAAAFKFGSDTLNASLQASYSRLKDRTHDTSDNIQKLSVGLEYRLAKDLWLVATIGGEGGRDNGKNNSFVLGSLKYGTATKPTDPRKQ
jgi:predicted porin